MEDLERRVGKGDQREKGLELSGGVQQTLFVAIQEANIFGQPAIETPDLLIGLIQVEPTKMVLEGAGITVNRIREVRKAMEGYSDTANVTRISTSGSIERVELTVPYRTIRMKKIGALAEIKAREKGRGLVEPEDLLIVLIEENDSAAISVLEAIGVDKKKLLEKISGSIIES